jgi:hypothetical protein
MAAITITNAMVTPSRGSGGVSKGLELAGGEGAADCINRRVAGPVSRGK